MKLREWVGDEVARTICKIPIPQNQMEDMMVFLGCDLTLYSVGKAYKCITSAGSNGRNE